MRGIDAEGEGDAEEDTEEEGPGSAIDTEDTEEGPRGKEGTRPTGDAIHIEEEPGGYIYIYICTRKAS